jgi:hypothetical protein
MNRHDDLRRMREARFKTVTKTAAVVSAPTPRVASTQHPVETTDCPVCAARRKANAQAQARGRARLSAQNLSYPAQQPLGR